MYKTSGISVREPVTFPPPPPLLPPCAPSSSNVRFFAFFGGLKVFISPLKVKVTVQSLPTQLSTTLAEAGSGESTPKDSARAENR
jgi:hypothetical protein